MSAEHLDLDVEARTALLTGGVKLVKGSLTIACPRVEVRYDQVPHVTWARGSGGVVAAVKGVRAEAPEVELDLAGQALSLRGGVRLTRGEGWITADQATIQIASGKVSMTGVKGSIPWTRSPARSPRLDVADRARAPRRGDQRRHRRRARAARRDPRRSAGRGARRLRPERRREEHALSRPRRRAAAALRAGAPRGPRRDVAPALGPRASRPRLPPADAERALGSHRGREPRGVSIRRRRARPAPAELAAELGLAGRLDVRAGSLSGGERRRLELARALSASPRAALRRALRGDRSARRRPRRRSPARPRCGRGRGDHRRPPRRRGPRALSPRRAPARGRGRARGRAGGLSINPLVRKHYVVLPEGPPAA